MRCQSFAALVILCTLPLSASAWDEPADGPIEKPRGAVIARRPPPAEGVIPHDVVGENPFVEYSGYGEGACCGPGGCGPCFSYWGNVDMLMWWRRSTSLPALVTSSPFGTPANDSGVLPAADVLYGNEEVGGRMRIGGRVEAGMWLDRCQSIGVGFRFATIGKETNSFSANSVDTPILARPFFDVTPDGNGNVIGENALLVAHPNGGPQGELTTGDIFVQGTNELYTTDILMRRALARNCNFAADCVFGYQTSRINEDLLIRSNTVLNGTLTIQDLFETRNTFHGGAFGFSGMWDNGCWTLDGLAKIGLGNMHQQAQISGRRTPAPAQGNANVGLLALTSNSGVFTQNDFAVVPEISLRLGCRVGANVKLTAGYSLLYWSTITRPADLIDRTINPSQIGGALAGESRPTFRFQTNDFWVQGLNLGVQWDF